MKKVIIGIFSIIVFIAAIFAYAENSNFELEMIKECKIPHGGDSCMAEFEITNNTGGILDGQSTLHIDYQGVCSGDIKRNFDGEGLEAEYKDSLSKTGWNNGDIIFSDFTIEQGVSYSYFKIDSDINLCPGKYTFELTIKGEGEEGEEGGGTAIGSAGKVLSAHTDAKKEIKEGGLIRNPNAEGMLQFDIYIVKLIGDKQFKRLILNPHVFESYEHLDWNDVKLVEQDVMDSYTTSSLVRVRDYEKSIFENEVYKLFPNGDVGIKRHLNMSKSEFEAREYDADSIYEINVVDRDAYTTGEDIK